MTPGSRHYAVSLLQLYCVCRGPLKPSIVIGDVGLYTQTHMQTLNRCVVVFFWQLNAFQVYLACWGHRRQPQWRVGCLHQLIYLQCQPEDDLKITACSFNYILQTLQ